MSGINRVYLFFNAIYWLCFLHVPWPNHGGYGMALPGNLFAWCFMFLVSFLILLKKGPRQFRVSATLIWLLAGIICLSVPLIWCSETTFRLNALPRIAALWGGGFFYFCLLQKQRTRDVQLQLSIIVIAGAIECILVLMELLFPQILPYPLETLIYEHGKYAAGIFQQVNVTASFISAAFSACLILMARDTEGKKAVAWLLMATSVLMSMTLTLLQSRIGLLGGVVAIISIQILFVIKKNRGLSDNGRRLLVCFLPCVGFILGMLLPETSISGLAHTGSNQQRLLTLRYTFLMIYEKPWTGWGLGSFAYHFQNILANLPGWNPSAEVMLHPHNELLYIWVEGGIIALAGAAMLIRAGCLLCIRKDADIWHWGGVITMLPILLHTQVEFPLYYSVPHYLLLLQLMAAIDTHVLVPKKTEKSLQTMCRWVAMGIALYSLLVCSRMFLCSVKLGEFESGRMVAPETLTQLSIPFLMQPRYERDLILLHLVCYKHDHNPRQLLHFMNKNGEWIKLNMDENAYNDQVNVLNYFHRQKTALQLKFQAHKLFPLDERFWQERASVPSVTRGH